MKNGAKKKKPAPRASSKAVRPAGRGGELRELRQADAAKGRLLQLLGRITSQHTVDGICRAAVEGIRELMNFERAGLFLWEDGIRTFRGTFGTDMDLKTTDEHAFTIQILPGSPEERIVHGSVIERGCKLGSPEPGPDEEGIKADLLGLRCGGRLYGLLSVDNRLSRRPILEWELEHLMLVSQVLGNAIDISRARVALVQSEERFRQVAENSGEWIWELDREGRYTYSSPVVRSILGRDPEEVVGQSLVRWVVDDEKARVAAELHRASAGKGPIRNLINHHVHKKGFAIALETSAIPLFEADGRLCGFRGAHRDVTRENELEEQLRHSQKIEAIGRLAGGIAHEFNNLLTAILGGGSLLLEEMSEEDPRRADVAKITAAGERAASLTRQLLAFSRRQILHVDRLDVNRVVGDMQQLLVRTLGEDIELVTRLEKNLALIEADADQLRQVLLHLAINARDAMTDPEFMVRAPVADRAEVDALRASLATREKQLFLGTDNAMLDESFCAKNVGLKPGPYVLITVRDTGIGMPAEVREHLFEPFFTTKEVGQGSGLGLSTVYGILQQMGGYVTVDSVLGQGTTFRLYLPLAGIPPKPEVEVKKGPVAAQGKETILVVEDEEVVRHLTVRMLQALGYRTLQAVDGAQGLEICRNYDQPIDLILTDMIMPHMSGKQFVEELRKNRKGFKVLFVSGYSADDTVGGKVIGTDTPLIQKPFTKDTLARKVREVLDDGKSSTD